MQVFCANCQLSFEAPEGATGLQCPICRNTLKPADGGGGGDKGRDTASVAQDWSGGSLDELVATLSAPSLSARVEVIAPDGTPAGEVYVLAGGVSDALIKGHSEHDALDKLRLVKNAKFRVEQRFPNPADGDLATPGPESGKLEERSLPILMRYCEDFVLTASIEVWRGSENAKVDYRRGEIVGVTVGGIDAPERLAEVMQWHHGQYRVTMPPLVLPTAQPKQVEAPVPQAQVTGRPASAGKTIFGMPALDIAAMAAAAQKQVEQARARAAETGVASAPAPAPRPVAEKAPATAAKTMVGVAAIPPAAEKPAKAPTGAEAKAAEAKAKTTFADKKAAKREAERNEMARKLSAEMPVASDRPAEKTTAIGRPSASKEPVKESKEDRALSTRPKPSESAGKETSVWTYMGVGFIFGLALLGVYRVVLSILH